MKRKTLILLLAAEAVLIAVLALMTKLFPLLFTSVLSFPMEQISAGAKALSGTGAVGNGLAMALIAGISLIPAVFALRYPRGKETLAERITLFVLCAVLLLAFRGMVIPTAFRPGVPESARSLLAIDRAVLSLTVWSVLILFIVLRLIRLFRAGNREQLFRYLRILVIVLCFYFTAQFAFALVTGILSPVAGGAPTTADILVHIVRLAADLIPLLFDITVLLFMLSLLEIASTEEQEGLADSANRLTGLSCIALAVTTGLCALKHVIQLPFLADITDVSANVDIPVVSIIFVVVILLFSRLLIENKRLREDNSLII